MGSSLDNNGLERPHVLSELLRRTLSLVEYYGHLEAHDASLFELKLALIRAVERLDAAETEREAADKGVEFAQAGPPRKGLTDKQQIHPT